MTQQAKKPRAPVETSEDVDGPKVLPDLEEVAKDQITSKVAEEFAGYGLATLMTALPGAGGMRCNQSAQIQMVG